jgi:LacI family transcriptional regulator
LEELQPIAILVMICLSLNIHNGRDSFFNMSFEKEVTIYDIAKELKLSASTISRALKGNTVINKTTRDKVVACAENLGYRSNSFASNLRRKRTYTIGVIIPRLDSNFMSSSIAGMEEVANEKGYNMIISQSHESVKKEAENARTMFDNRVDGVIASLTIEDSQLEYFNRFVDKKIPIVFFDRIPRKTGNVCVLIDNFEAAYQATKHLIDKGCSRLIHLTINSLSNVYVDREKGFEKAVEDNGCSGEVIYLNTLSLESGRAVVSKILGIDALPDGIFVSNDLAAVGCLLELKSNGIKIPDQISVIGFNNDPISLIVSPQLTTISYPGREAGILAASSLIGYLDGDREISSPNRLLLETKLIERESTNRLKTSN